MLTFNNFQHTFCHCYFERETFTIWCTWNLAYMLGVSAVFVCCKEWQDVDGVHWRRYSLVDNKTYIYCVLCSEFSIFYRLLDYRKLYYEQNWNIFCLDLRALSVFFWQQLNYPSTQVKCYWYCKPWGNWLNKKIYKVSINFSNH